MQTVEQEKIVPLKSGHQSLKNKNFKNAIYDENLMKCFYNQLQWNSTTVKEIRGNFFPMGIGIISISIYIHSHSFPFQLGIPIPWSSLVCSVCVYVYCCD